MLAIIPLLPLSALIILTGLEIPSHKHCAAVLCILAYAGGSGERRKGFLGSEVRVQAVSTEHARNCWGILNPGQRGGGRGGFCTHYTTVNTGKITTQRDKDLSECLVLHVWWE